MCLSVSQSVYVSVSLSMYLYVCVSLPVFFSVCLSVCLIVRLHACLPSWLSLHVHVSDRDIFHLNADYLFYDFHTIRVDAGKIPFYYGLGLRLVDEDRPKKDLNLGIRVPVGLHFFFKSSPVDIFLEVAPVVELTPDTDFTIDGSLGIHYRFR